jgi:hypothetical protein
MLSEGSAHVEWCDGGTYEGRCFCRMLYAGGAYVECCVHAVYEVQM